MKKYTIENDGKTDRVNTGIVVRAGDSITMTADELKAAFARKGLGWDAGMTLLKADKCLKVEEASNVTPLPKRGGKKAGPSQDEKK